MSESSRSRKAPHFPHSGEWKPATTKVSVCLTFDAPKFKVGSPNDAEITESYLKISQKDSYSRLLDLKKSIITSVEITSCEVMLSNTNNDNYADADMDPATPSDRAALGQKQAAMEVKPHFFSVALFDSKKKPIPHCTINAQGHPVGEQCRAKTYCSNTLTSRQQSNLQKFGNYTDADAFSSILNASEYSSSRGVYLPKHLQSIADEFARSERPHTESRQTEGAPYQKEELQAFIVAFQETMSEVEEMFYDMRGITGRLKVSANQNIEQDPDSTASLLVRLVVEIEIQAMRL